MNTHQLISDTFDALHLDASEDSPLYRFMEDLCGSDEPTTVDDMVLLYHRMMETIRRIYKEYGVEEVIDADFIQQFYERHDHVFLPKSFAEDCFYRLHPADQEQFVWIREMNGDLHQVFYSWEYGVDTLRQAIQRMDEDTMEDPAYLYTLSLVEDAPEEFSPQYVLVRLPRQNEWEVKGCDIVDTTTDGVIVDLCLFEVIDETYRGTTTLKPTTWTISVNLPTREVTIDQAWEEIYAMGMPTYEPDEQYSATIFIGSFNDLRETGITHEDSLLDLADAELREEFYQIVVQNIRALGLSI